MSENIVSLRNVVKHYTRGKQDVPVLDDLNLDIAAGEFVALMGPSGSGKTTLLNLIGGLDTPDLRARSPSPASARTSSSSGQLARWRANNVGFVFQFYNLMPMLNAQRNVELPLLLTRLSAAQARGERARPPSRWSASRTAPSTSPASSPAARRSAWRSRARWSPIPTLLVCDEPTGDLDRKSADEILQLLQTLEPRARQDHRHRHPRPEGRGIRQPPPAHGQGRVAGIRHPGCLTGRGAMKYLPLIWAIAVAQEDCAPSSRCCRS